MRGRLADAWSLFADYDLCLGEEGSAVAGTLANN